MFQQQKSGLRNSDITWKTGQPKSIIKNETDSVKLTH